ncbi:RHS repeat-associated core domain-containing protein [Desulfobotulus sp. H1]|uniref:RHS repeat-associated core domain-containing protein n=1 Tax=Desulfobotulus pelophilus TaxID=2823377 RepID=A0ABT3N760_9BACT|nr:RHS repeat-associated core domain-containing protein [Desulfobotulus pelophilus]MCW7753292.1 RHS repeat-associated core domain-containing protein [Desulfobotulus pelophilus]
MPSLISDGTQLYGLHGYQNSNLYRLEDDGERALFGEQSISATLSITGTAGESFFATEYTRDGLGRITEKRENGDSEAYEYDAAGRLIRVTRNGEARSFGYDANGNRTHENGVEVAVYDAEDRMLRHGDRHYAYTDSGELVSITENGSRTDFRYDDLGNLVAVDLPDGRSLSYLIDGQNRRIGRKVDGVLKQAFLYQDSLNPIAELDGESKLVSRFIYGDRFHVPAYMEKNGRRYRIISDHLGSPRLVVDARTGDVVQEMVYDVWGRIILDTNPGFQPFGFAGGLHDPETGLVRLGARDYDPVTGRWTAKDPILFAGGDSNLYGYVLNDPVNFIDPEGLAGIAIDFGGGYASGDGELGGRYSTGKDYGSGFFIGVRGEGDNHAQLGAFTYENTTGKVPGHRFGGGVNFTYYNNDAREFFCGDLNYVSYNLFGFSGVVYRDDNNAVKGWGVSMWGRGFGLTGRETGKSSTTSSYFLQK